MAGGGSGAWTETEQSSKRKQWMEAELDGWKRLQRVGRDSRETEERLKMKKMGAEEELNNCKRRTEEERGHDVCNRC